MDKDHQQELMQYAEAAVPLLARIIDLHLGNHGSNLFNFRVLNGDPPKIMIVGDTSAASNQGPALLNYFKSLFDLEIIAPPRGTSSLRLNTMALPIQGRETLLHIARMLGKELITYSDLGDIAVNEGGKAAINLEVMANVAQGAVSAIRENANDYGYSNVLAELEKAINRGVPRSRGD